MAPHVPTAQEVASLSAELGLQLDPDTRVLLVERESGMDDMVRAKLDMSRASFERALAALKITQADFSRGAGRLGADHGEWNPKQVSGVKSLSLPLAAGRYLNLGFGDTKDGRVIVFAMNHGT